MLPHGNMSCAYSTYRYLHLLKLILNAIQMKNNFAHTNRIREFMDAIQPISLANALHLFKGKKHRTHTSAYVSKMNSFGQYLAAVSQIHKCLVQKYSTWHFPLCAPPQKSKKNYKKTMKPFHRIFLLLQTEIL